MNIDGHTSINRLYILQLQQQQTSPYEPINSHIKKQA